MHIDKSATPPAQCTTPGWPESSRQTPALSITGVANRLEHVVSRLGGLSISSAVPLHLRLSLKPKSTLFKEVERSVRAHIDDRTAASCHATIDAIASWKRSKQCPLARTNWKDSPRAGQVERLDLWIIEEAYRLSVFSRPESGWDDEHNCYAYAMKCHAPGGVGNNSCPGRLAGRLTKGDFVSGVMADARHQDLDVRIDGTTPDCVPSETAPGRYLVALLANQHGFHFLRRDESTGLWSHKNGAIGKVESFLYDWAAEKPTAITDTVMGHIAMNPRMIGCSMQFTAYLSVPNAGMQVLG
ncbi:hypothetical protein [Pseudoxanthomonas sp. UTMC 1351]|uniref:hypothetical protein n=1 Tax=Pseudoxanthomonas sp. UTMC 1351 TaxID=2695853 RepID=UPI0034CFF5A0